MLRVCFYIEINSCKSIEYKWESRVIVNNAMHIDHRTLYLEISFVVHFGWDLMRSIFMVWDRSGWSFKIITIHLAPKNPCSTQWQKPIDINLWHQRKLTHFWWPSFICLNTEYTWHKIACYDCCNLWAMWNNAIARLRFETMLCFQSTAP